MYTFLRKVLRYYEGEGAKLFIFFLLAIAVQAGISIGINLGDVFFLTRVGADKLPILFIIMPILMLIFVPLYSALTSRWGTAKVFILTASWWVVSSVILFFVVKLSNAGFFSSNFVFYLYKLHSYVWLVSGYTLFWNFIDEYYDIVDAKRLFPVLSGGLSLGGALGGACVSGFSPLFGVAFCYLIWAAFALFTIPLLIFVQKKWKVLTGSFLELNSEKEKIGFLSESSLFLKSIKNSKYVLILVIAMFFTYFFSTVCEFHVLDIFSMDRKETELATLFGKLYLIVNIINIIIDLFFFNRIIQVLGVRNVLLIQPICYFIAFLGFSFSYTDYAAYLGFFVFQGIFYSIDLNNWNFIFNAVAEKQKQRVRTLSEGLIDPLASSLSGVFLLLASVVSHKELALITLLLSCLFFFVALMLRRSYKGAMVKNLQDNWLDFSNANFPSIMEIKNTDLEIIHKKLLKEDEIFICDFVKHLYKEDSNFAASFVLSLLDLLSESEVHKFKSSLNFLLSQENSDVVKMVYQWLQNKEGDYDSLAIVLAIHGLLQVSSYQDKLNNDNLDSQELAVVAFLKSWNPYDNKLGFNHLIKMFEGNELEQVVAIKILGFGDKPSYAKYLLPYLNSDSNLICITALNSIFNLVDQNCQFLENDLLSFLARGNKIERKIILKIISKIGDSQTIVPILKMSDSFSPQERRQVENMLYAQGLKIIPVVVNILNDRNFSYSARSIAARALGRLSFTQFESRYESLVEQEITVAYEYFYNSFYVKKMCDDNQELLLLAKFYEDFYLQTIEFLLELLTIGGRLPGYEMISSSLRSHNLKSRGNVIETLEQGISYHLFKQLLPLIDSRSDEEKVEFYLKNSKAKKNFSLNALLSQALNSSSDYEATVAAVTFFEIDPEKALTEIQLLVPQKIALKQNIFVDVSLKLLSNLKDFGIMDKLNLLVASPVFEEFSFFDLMKIALNSEYYERQEALIMREGDSIKDVYFVNSGLLNDKKVVGINVVGLKEIFSQKFSKQTYKVKEASYLKVSSKTIEDLVQSSPRFGVNLLQKMAGI